ncbi:calvin cycle protein CP12-1, chloroplastic-like [Andrographis paniculata]|uniref:calvin cycle protein CP12-1, chloroplastic-like n=1 Tax=Andrographis paniculata TaxID=175694 RepID=UPI0021E7052E|nr:calvin cycle protein CP12-1, chloroplastic-like [Andrographis paniculata]
MAAAAVAARGGGVTVAAPKFITKASSESSIKAHAVRFSLWKKRAGGRMTCVGPVAAGAPDQISGKVEESIKNAQEVCSDDPISGECAAAWDEVEELSAEASHAKDRKKESDPLENFCKDNPETDECRTYDN